MRIYLFITLILFLSNASRAELTPGEELDSIQTSKFGQPVSPLKVIQKINNQDNVYRLNNKFIDFRKSPTTSNQFKVSIENGRLTYRGSLLNTDNEKFMYIVENDGEIYGSFLPSGNFIGNGKAMFHTSLVKNEWPIFAGEMDVKNGLVTFLDNRSGHFQPTGSRTRILENYFRKEGLLDQSFQNNYISPPPIQLPRSSSLAYRDGVVETCK